MHRIVILGCAGTGKSTFARRLSEQIGARLVTLDSIWQMDWTAHDVPAFRELVIREHAGDAWISDGNFAMATFDLRLHRATLVIWLEGSRLQCSWRAIKRAFAGDAHHRVRQLFTVLAFIWRFDRINRPRIEAGLREHGPNVPVVHVYHRSDLERLLASFQP